MHVLSSRWVQVPPKIVSLFMVVAFFGAPARASVCEVQAKRASIPEMFENLLESAMTLGAVSEEDVRAMIAAENLATPVANRRELGSLDFDTGFNRLLHLATAKDKEEMRRRAERVLERKIATNKKIDEAKEQTKNIFYFKRRPEFHSFPLPSVGAGRLLVSRRGEVFAISVEAQVVVVREFSAGNEYVLREIKGKESLFTWDVLEMSSGEIVLARIAENWLSVVDVRTGSLLASKNLKSTEMPQVARDGQRVLVPHVFESEGQAKVVVAPIGTWPFDPKKKFSVGILSVSENNFEELNLDSAQVKVERATNDKLYAYGIRDGEIFFHDFMTGKENTFALSREQTWQAMYRQGEPKLYLDQASQPQLFFPPAGVGGAALFDQVKNKLVVIPASEKPRGYQVQIYADNKGQLFSVGLREESSTWDVLPLKEGGKEIPLSLSLEAERGGYQLHAPIETPYGAYLLAWEFGNNVATMHVGDLSTKISFRVDVPRAFNAEIKLWSPVRYIDGTYLLMLRGNNGRIALYQFYGP